MDEADQGKDGPVSPQDGSTAPLPRDAPPASGLARPASPSTTPDKGGTSATSQADAGEQEAVQREALGAALRYHLHQPQVFKAFGLEQPPTSIPVCDADGWVESWRVTASSDPHMQAKISAHKQLT